MILFCRRSVFAGILWVLKHDPKQAITAAFVGTQFWGLEFEGCFSFAIEGCFPFAIECNSNQQVTSPESVLEMELVSSIAWNIVSECRPSRPPACSCMLPASCPLGQACQRLVLLLNRLVLLISLLHSSQVGAGLFTPALAHLPRWNARPFSCCQGLSERFKNSCNPSTFNLALLYPPEVTSRGQ